LKLYREAAAQLQHVSFLGRLATYRYMDMHHVIDEALQFAKTIGVNMAANTPLPVFSNIETF
ncbi:MAG: UDP-galactopyranose mutase, partial [Ferruginibacter sp.]|nr:UDP-galactopyranose mutase [Ferruginibacter sp.]